MAVRLLLQQVNLPVVMKKTKKTKNNHNIATKYLETTVADLIMKLKSEFVKGLEFLGGERVTCTGTGKNIHHHLGLMRLRQFLAQVLSLPGKRLHV